MLSISLRSEVFKIGGDCIYKHFVPTALFPTDSNGVEASFSRCLPNVAGNIGLEVVTASRYKTLHRYLNATPQAYLYASLLIVPNKPEPERCAHQYECADECKRFGSC